MQLPRHKAGQQKKKENSLLSMFSQGWKKQIHGPHLHFSWEKVPPGSAQLAGGSLVISVSLCLPHSPTDPPFLSTEGIQQPTRAAPALWTQPGAAHSPHPPLQDIPASSQGILWVSGTAPVTHTGSIRAQGQALCR